MGPITARAGVARVGDAKACHHGRQLAAGWRVVPKHLSTGGKPVVGRITQRGKVSVRTLLLQGARSVLQCTAKRTDAKRVGGGGSPPAPGGQGRGGGPGR